MLKVFGILKRTGTQDEGVIFAPLATVQAAFDLPGRMSGIGITLKDMADLPAFGEDMNEETAMQVIGCSLVKTW